MADILRYQVPPAATGRPIADWLATRFTYLDAAAWAAAVESGRILRNGARARPGELLAADDVITYTPPASSRPAPDITIVHDDPDFVVVDKPPHYVVQRHGAFAHNTFLPALEERLGTSLEPVHRLDRETSGLLLLAKNGAAAAPLQQQFEAGEVDKRYLAIVRGVIAADEHRVDAAIGRDRHSVIRDRRAVVAPDAAGARAARTDVTVERRFGAHTLVAAVPRSGRTHQIRVHLAHLGHPIVGDKLHGASDGEYLAWVRHLKSDGDPRRDTRQMLHASELSFCHPRTDERLTLVVGVPADMQTMLGELARMPCN